MPVSLDRAMLASSSLALLIDAVPPDIPIVDKVRFLRDPRHYPGDETDIEERETHFSWVFLTRRHAYKLKKPASGEGFDFRSVEGRLRNARAELRLNRRLAPRVYLGIVALTRTSDGALQLGGEGRPIDWLVKMRRLETDWMLDSRLLRRAWSYGELEALGARLAQFFATARPAWRTSAAHIRQIRSELDRTGRAISALGEPRLLIVGGVVQRCLGAFLVRRRRLLCQRVAERRLIDGHGDLRPEHVYLRDTPQIIDCLEFRPDLRRLDPLSEISFLTLECGQLAMSPVGSMLLRRYRLRIGDEAPAELIAFYTALNALIRARLSIEHIAEPGSRTHSQWIERAATYLTVATEVCQRLRR